MMSIVEETMEALNDLVRSGKVLFKLISLKNENIIL
jgi:aryl-alcohol dehydrogenase-like predicted oxidoreductase